VVGADGFEPPTARV